MELGELEQTSGNYLDKIYYIHLKTFNGYTYSLFFGGTFQPLES